MFSGKTAANDVVLLDGVAGASLLNTCTQRVIVVRYRSA